MDFTKSLAPQLTKKQEKSAAYNAKVTADKARRAEIQKAVDGMRADAEKSKTQTADKVETALAASETYLTARKAELIEAVCALTTADELTAVLIKRKLKAVSLKLKSTIALRNVVQKRDRDENKYIGAAVRKLTPDEYDTIMAERKAARAAEKALLAHAAANPTLPISHDTRVSSVGAAVAVLPAIVVAETGAAFKKGVEVGVREIKESVKVPVDIRQTNLAERSKYAMADRFQS